MNLKTEHSPVGTSAFAVLSMPSGLGESQSAQQLYRCENDDIYTLSVNTSRDNTLIGPYHWHDPFLFTIFQGVVININLHLALEYNLPWGY